MWGLQIRLNARVNFRKAAESRMKKCWSREGCKGDKVALRGGVEGNSQEDRAGQPVVWWLPVKRLVTGDDVARAFWPDEAMREK